MTYVDGFRRLLARVSGWLKRPTFDATSVAACGEGAKPLFGLARAGQCDVYVASTQLRIDKFFTTGPIRIIAYFATIPARQQNQIFLGKLCKFPRPLLESEGQSANLADTYQGMVYAKL